MDKYWKLEHYNLSIQHEMLIQDFSLTMTCNSYVCLLGQSGCGKTSLLKALHKGNSTIQIQASIQFYLGETMEARKWYEDIKNVQLNEHTQKFIQLFMSNGSYLNYKYALLSKMIKHPDILFCDDLHHILTNNEFQLWIQYLKEEHISLFYVTNQIEQTIYFQYLYVIQNKKIAMEGNTLDIYQEEKLMKLMGYSLPFYINLSIQLGYYDLLNGMYMNEKELEEKLWQSK